MESYEGYREGAMQNQIAKYVEFILYTIGENSYAKAAGSTSVPGLFEDVEQGFSFRKTNRFERTWIVYTNIYKSISA
jgi:hypothetical protein